MKKFARKAGGACADTTQRTQPLGDISLSQLEQLVTYNCTNEGSPGHKTLAKPVASAVLKMQPKQVTEEEMRLSQQLDCILRMGELNGDAACHQFRVKWFPRVSSRIWRFKNGSQSRCGCNTMLGPQSTESRQGDTSKHAVLRE